MATKEMVATVKKITKQEKSATAKVNLEVPIASANDLPLGLVKLTVESANQTIFPE